MKIIITGGGTGGHLFPALIIAKELREKGHKVFYFGNENCLEKNHAEKDGFPFYSVSSKSTLKKDWHFLKENIKGVKESLQYFKQIKPDVVFSTGGFTTAPTLLAAKLTGVPMVLHEQNAVIGMVHRLFRKSAHRFIHSYPNDIKKKEYFIGNLSRFDNELKRTNEYVTFMGGSGGAKFINELAIQYAKDQPTRKICLLSGQNFEIEKNIPNLHVLPFVENMEMVYGMSDIVVARAGSTTLAELSSLGVPSVIIPMPNSADDHQRKNAQYYEKQKAIYLVEQNEETYQKLTQFIHHTNINKKNELSKRIQECYNQKAKQEIVEKIVQL